jgi:antibiotic biosynthesis monooxygenase (ABM) superfamily enzyme
MKIHEKKKGTEIRVVRTKWQVMRYMGIFRVVMGIQFFFISFEYNHPTVHESQIAYNIVFQSLIILELCRWHIIPLCVCY